MSKILEITNLS